MKSYTLYSLFFIKNVTRLLYVTLMIEYLFFLIWWQMNPYNHLQAVWMPLLLTACYCFLLFLFYQYRLKNEKIKVTETHLFYYKQRFLLNQISFYPVEVLNNRIHIIAFQADQDKTFIFSTFLQKKRYLKLKEHLKLVETSSDATPDSE